MPVRAEIGVPAWLLALSMVAAGSCGRPALTSRAPLTADTVTRRALFSALEDVVPPGARRPTLSSVRFVQDSSLVVPALTYTWAVYRPLDSDHARWLQLAASRHGRFRVVNTPNEWMDVARPDWPQEEQAVLRLCGEMLRTVGPRRDPDWPPRIFVDRASLRDLDSVLADLAFRTLAPPMATVRDSDWVATLWAVEFGRVAKYECRLTAGHGALTVLDSVTSLGPRYRP